MNRGALGRLLDPLERLTIDALELCARARRRIRTERDWRRAARAWHHTPRIPLSTERRQLFVAEDRRQ